MEQDQCIENKDLVPIGVAPFYICDKPRMVDLLNAISRYLVYVRSPEANRQNAYKQIAKWAYELKLRAEAEVELFEEGK